MIDLKKHQDQIRTEQTYATANNARKALEKALGNLDRVRYLIAVSPKDGRFAPVVMLESGRPELINLAHNGVTVIG